MTVMIRRRWCLLGDAGIISDVLDKTRYDGFLMNYVFYTFIAGSMDGVSLELISG